MKGQEFSEGGDGSLGAVIPNTIISIITLLTITTITIRILYFPDGFEFCVDGFGRFGGSGG